MEKKVFISFLLIQLFIFSFSFGCTSCTRQHYDDNGSTNDDEKVEEGGGDGQLSERRTRNEVNYRLIADEEKNLDELRSNSEVKIRKRGDDQSTYRIVFPERST